VQAKAFQKSPAQTGKLGTQRIGGLLPAARAFSNEMEIASPSENAKKY